ncbi:ABC transporter permease [Natrarchaeobius oligotrophus]|uniref:Copper ABC transporter permease n=1 Tax=Natrarchaeobius chitinivorans TaxID=1679083 RepID=A0A3N6PPW6_NATCH|nr:ABC transporter permease subunit [Natrarchaeobius chitinivorans]RQH01266.1 hypothetical protein EA472_07375 [Natrarchaeobius chitinivorans]
MSATRASTRRDLARLVRSRTAWLAATLFAAVALASWIPWIGSDYLLADDRPLLLAVSGTTPWIPLFAIALGLAAIRTEREPASASDATRTDSSAVRTFGAIGARSVVLVATVAIVVALMAAFARFHAMRPLSFVGGVAAVSLFGLAWLGTTVGVASVLETKRRALAVVLGLYLLFGILWRETVVALASFVFTGQTSPDLEEPVVLASLEEPAWYAYLTRLNPFDAFEGATYYLPRVLEAILLGESTVAPHPPNLFGLGVLLAWLVGPVAIGYWSVQRSETG